MIFMHIPRKIIKRYPLNSSNTPAIPNLLTGYPQVAKFSGDDVFCNRSDDSFLSRGEPKKDGSNCTGKSLQTGPLIHVSLAVIQLDCIHHAVTITDQGAAVSCVVNWTASDCHLLFPNHYRQELIFGGAAQS